MADGTWASPRALDTRLTGRAAASALACLALATARADWVEVRVEGLADGPRENVMAALDIAHPSSELSAARLRERHGIGLFEPVNVFHIRYEMLDKWQLEAETGEGTSGDLVYTVERGRGKDH